MKYMKYMNIILEHGSTENDELNSIEISQKKLLNYLIFKKRRTHLIHSIPPKPQLLKQLLKQKNNY